jgi:uncharacterized protein YfiM (DUF2279 family)
MPAGDFDLDALHDALDTERRAKKLSWQELAREISAQFGRTGSRPIAASTLSGMRGKRVIEGDGVLQALRWLNRTPESFVPGHTPASDEVLPHVESDRILRFDAVAIYKALDAQRATRGLSWPQVAREIGGIAPGSLTRLANGGRVGFPEVMRIFRWLGRSAASFTREASR